MGFLEFLDGDFSSLLVISTLITILMLYISFKPTGYDIYENWANTSTAPSIRPVIQIVVLGDIGRSPRMQYHALSIAHRGGRVQLVGYLDTKPHKDLLGNPLIEIFPIPPPPGFLAQSSRSLFVVIGPLKVLWQFAVMWNVMAYKTYPPKFLIVQNPPSIPTLFLAWIISMLRSSAFVIDWHNFGYSILALKLSARHPLVLLYKWIELFFGRQADIGFTVTGAMATVLKQDYGVRSLLLEVHDRPPSNFQPITETQRRKDTLSQFGILEPYMQGLQDGSTRLVVSSTSWTPDEDFTVLLQALELYSAAESNGSELPHLLVVITGRGPGKDGFFKLVEAAEAANKLARATIVSAWLAAEDYPTFLACADLGICLHTSSSGLDLPMKVVDMFGAGLPVLAWDGYPSFPELVKHGMNGYGFHSAETLADQLRMLFLSSIASSTAGKKVDNMTTAALTRLRESVLDETKWRWDDEWEKVANLLHL